MNTLSQSLPSGLSLETLGGNLASLAMTPSLRAITGTVLKQWRSPEAFRPLAKHGIYPIRQLLFYGPPGNGKTSACQWLSQQLGVPLYRVRCEQLVDPHLGRTAAKVGSVMEWLSGQKPAIVLFDEVESLFPARGADSSACSREMSSAMTVYWQWLDRWTRNHLFVLATNMHESLDPALRSRIELQLEFGPPNEQQSHEVISYWAEVLHEYGAEDWAAELRGHLNQGDSFTSFRELWQQIQRHVSNHITRSLEEAA